MGQVKHVTSEAIVGLADDIDSKVKPQITVTKTTIDECEIDQPKFGLVGIPLEFGYSKIMQDFQTFLDTFSAKLDDIATTLRNDAAPGWQHAEDANTVRYGDA
jgi:hypothetical protein